MEPLEKRRPPWELDERETAILEAAARQADDIAALERAIAKDGRVIKGSRGQPRLNQAVIEVRQARLALARHLGSLALPDEQAQLRTAASLRGERAANARYQRKVPRRGPT